MCADSYQRLCKSCQGNLTESARKCPRCKSIVGICPSCGEDSVFERRRKGRTIAKIENIITNFGYPTNLYAVCCHCDNDYLFCEHCYSPSSSKATNCSVCGEKISIGIVPIAKDIFGVIRDLPTKKFKK